MLPCFSPLAVETLEHPLPKERRSNASFLTASLAEETLEHPLPKERRLQCFLSFLL